MYDKKKICCLCRGEEKVKIRKCCFMNRKIKDMIKKNYLVNGGWLGKGQDQKMFPCRGEIKDLCARSIVFSKQKLFTPM